MVKVYALGLYVDSSAPASSLGSFKSMRSSELSQSNLFFQTLIEAKFSKTLLLIFHRAVGADAIAGAIREALAKTLSAASVQKFSKSVAKVLPQPSIHS